MTAAYPLQWPAGRQRTPGSKRKPGRFKTARESGFVEAISIASAVGRLRGELERLGARLPVISTNIETRRDGLPRSGQREPDDPGVAVYFQLGGRPHCMPCDTYLRVADNIAAIAAHIEATRAIERHGVATVSEMFAGFVALPPSTRDWRLVLGLSGKPTADDVQSAFRKRAMSAHPDVGGSHAAMAELAAARDAALKEIRP